MVESHSNEFLMPLLRNKIYSKSDKSITAKALIEAWNKLSNQAELHKKDEFNIKYTDRTFNIFTANCRRIVNKKKSIEEILESKKTST